MTVSLSGKTYLTEIPIFVVVVWKILENSFGLDDLPWFEHASFFLSIVFNIFISKVMWSKTHLRKYKNIRLLGYIYLIFPVVKISYKTVAFSDL